MPFLSISQVFDAISQDEISCTSESLTDSIKVFNGLEIENLKPILGTYTRKNQSTLFSPYIAFQYNKTYSATCGERDTTFTISLPESYEKPEVISLFPSSNVWPANLLKFYVKFSRPMAINAYQHINLLDNDGSIIHRGILQEIPELWNEDKTLLCVWIEPGRIKRALGPNQLLGPVLQSGKRYKLNISKSIKDQNGISLAGEFQHEFVVEAPDRRSPSTERWVLSIRDNKNFHIKFDEPLDYGSAKNAFDVEGISGKWLMSQDQMSITFEATGPIKEGRYRININPKIEDLAGNNLDRLFDQDIKLNTRQIQTHHLLLEVKE